MVGSGGSDHSIAIAAGIDRPEILVSYPSLKPADIDAALSYAADRPGKALCPFPLELSA